MMKVFIVLASIALVSITALPFKDVEQLRLHGENGWYVPQIDGSLKWLNKTEGEAEVKRFELENNRLTLNDVTYYLYTKANPEIPQIIWPNRASIDASNYNAANPTRFIIHGWNSNYRDGVNTGIRRAWFTKGDYNMISVDWNRGRSIEYASSVAGISITGKNIARFIDFLVEENALSLETLEVVGFSLGAHVAGLTAKQVTKGKINKVIGLDPAGPLMNYNRPEKRIASTDALYVESIQTNGGFLGFSQPIGQAAFYPGGGKMQLGCENDSDLFCSHKMAATYYKESIIYDNFPAIKCKSYKDANNLNCGSTFSSVRMGSKLNQHQLGITGEYYVPTNVKSPFGLAPISNSQKK